MINREGRVILGVLCEQTPSALRRLLVEPDPVMLHDWHMTRAEHDDLVRVALDIITKP